MLKGRFEFLIESSRLEAGPGSLIYISRGKLHALKNIGGVTGRLLMTQTPGDCTSASSRRRASR